MTVRYIIRDLSENLLATVETAKPVAHLTIGTNLVLSADDYAPADGTWLRVEHIMIGLASDPGGEELVGVICSVQSRQSTTVAQGHTPNSYQDMLEHGAKLPSR